MEYIYAALTIHKSGGKVDESTVKNVLTAAGTTPDDAKIKALVASLEGVNIDEAIEKTAVAPVAVAPVAAQATGGEAKEAKEEKKEEKKEEQASAAGLGALFG